MRTGQVIVLGLAGVLAANMLFTYGLTRRSNRQVTSQVTDSSVVPYHTHDQVPHKHSNWDIDLNPHVHRIPIDADTTATAIHKYLANGKENTQFKPGQKAEDYIGGFF